MKRRIANIMRRMSNGNDFYTNDSPRITNAEVKEIEQLTGCLLQHESIHGAERGSPIAVYPLHKQKFIEAVEKLLTEAQ